MSLVFYPKSHRYKLDGAWVPGVTTLLGDGLPKKALMYWSARTVAEFVADNQADIEAMWGKGRGPMVAYLKEVPWQRRDDAALRGTEIHGLAEAVARGEEVEVPDVHHGAVEAYVDWLDRNGVRPVLTERAVASRQWSYAGTFDLIAEMHGQTWLLDLKTARGVYGDNALQLAAYANAEFYVDQDGQERPLPRVDRLGVVHVEDGECTLWPVTDPDSAFKDFLHAAWIARAKRRIAGYLPSPIDITPEDAA